MVALTLDTFLHSKISSATQGRVYKRDKTKLQEEKLYETDKNNMKEHLVGDLHA